MIVVRIIITKFSIYSMFDFFSIIYCNSQKFKLYTNFFFESIIIITCLWLIATKIIIFVKNFVVVVLFVVLFLVLFIIMWARNVRQIRYNELWICDNVKLLYKDKYVDLRRLIVEKIFFTSKFLKYSNKVFELLIFLQVERKTS